MSCEVGGSPVTPLSSVSACAMKRPFSPSLLEDGAMHPRALNFAGPDGPLYIDEVPLSSLSVSLFASFPLLLLLLLRSNVCAVHHCDADEVLHVWNPLHGHECNAEWRNATFCLLSVSPARHHFAPKMTECTCGCVCYTLARQNSSANMQGGSCCVCARLGSL